MENKRQRPSFCAEDHLDYLDELRDSGEINMWGAAEYLELNFALTREEAAAIWAYWTRTYKERHPKVSMQPRYLKIRAENFFY